MSGSVDTGSTSTKSNNKAVDQLTTTLASSLNKLYAPTGSTYVAPSSTTTNSWQQALNAANNGTYTGGLAGALASYGNRAAGNELGLNDPLYQQQRATLTDDVLKTVNGQFNSMGQLGSDQSRTAAARGLADSLGALDTQQRNESYNRQAEGANMLSSLYQASLLPSSITGSVGAAQDADAQAKALGGLDYLGKFMSLLNGASGAAGTTTTTSMPWWKVGLGTAATALGAL